MSESAAEEEARATLMASDPEMVSRAAIRAGKEKWGELSWAERLKVVTSGTPHEAPLERKSSRASNLSHMMRSASKMSKTSKSSKTSISSLSTEQQPPPQRQLSETRVSSKPPTPASQPRPSFENAVPESAAASELLERSYGEVEVLNKTQMSQRSQRSSPAQRLGSVVSSQRSGLPPTAPPPASPPSVDTRALQQQVTTLRADVDAAQSEMQKWRTRALQAEKALKEKEAGGDRDTDELERVKEEADELRREVEELRQQQHQTRDAGEDVSLLLAQIWTLEKALELRTNEATRLNSVVADYCRTIDTLDRKLADALRRLLQQAKEEAEQEEQLAFGMPAIEAVGEVKRKRTRRKARRGSTASTGAREAELGLLREENDRLKIRLRQQQQQQQQLLPGDHHQLLEKEKIIASLQLQLEKAQEAIVKSVEQGQALKMESDTKLKHTRSVIKTLLKQKQAEGARGRERDLVAMLQQRAPSPLPLPPPPATSPPENFPVPVVEPAMPAESLQLDLEDLPVWSLTLAPAQHPVPGGLPAPHQLPPPANDVVVPCERRQQNRSISPARPTAVEMLRLQ